MLVGNDCTGAEASLGGRIPAWCHLMMSEDPATRDWMGIEAPSCCDWSDIEAPACWLDIGPLSWSYWLGIRAAVHCDWMEIAAPACCDETAHRGALLTHQTQKQSAALYAHDTPGYWYQTDSRVSLVSGL